MSQIDELNRKIGECLTSSGVITLIEANTAEECQILESAGFELVGSLANGQYIFRIVKNHDASPTVEQLSKKLDTLLKEYNIGRITKPENTYPHSPYTASWGVSDRPFISGPTSVNSPNYNPLHILCDYTWDYTCDLLKKNNSSNKK